MTIKEIKELLNNGVSEEEFAALKNDPRSGVQKLLTTYKRKQELLLKKKNNS